MLSFSLDFLKILFLFFFLTPKTFCIGVQQLTMFMIVSGEQRRDSAIHIHISILPQIALPFRLPHHTEQSPLCSTVGPCGHQHYFTLFGTLCKCCVPSEALSGPPAYSGTQSHFACLIFFIAIIPVIPICYHLALSLIFMKAGTLTFSELSQYNTLDTAGVQ